MGSVLVEGFAYLCFFDDGSWFQGTMFSSSKKQYGVMGETSDPPERGFAECCFEDEPLFYTITLIDHKGNEEKVYKDIMKTGGDNCTLTSHEILFETEELLVGSKMHTFSNDNKSLDHGSLDQVITELYNYLQTIRMSEYQECVVPEPSMEQKFIFQLGSFNPHESHVAKYCRSELQGKDCIVCGGRLTVYAQEESN